MNDAKKATEKAWRTVTASRQYVGLLKRMIAL